MFTEKRECREINTTGVPAAAPRVPAAAAALRIPAASALRIPAAAAERVPAAVAARGYTDAPDSAISDCPFPETTRGFCLQTSLYCEYFGAHVLWQDVFLQNAFATLSKDDMASSRKNRVALQTLATAV